INVNGLAPGYVKTESTIALQRDTNRYDAILARIPTGRWAEPVDMVGAAVYLASPASDYVNGHILDVDGGWLSRWQPSMRLFIMPTAGKSIGSLAGAVG